MNRKDAKGAKYQKLILYLKEFFFVSFASLRFISSIHLQPAIKMAKVIAVDGYARFDKMFVAIYLIGRAKSVNTQFERTAGV